MGRVAKALIGTLIVLLSIYTFMVAIPYETQHVNTKFFVNWNGFIEFIAYCREMSYSKQYSVGLSVLLTPQDVDKYLNLDVEPKSAVFFLAEPLKLNYQVLVPTEENAYVFGFYLNSLTTNRTCNISITRLNLSYSGTWFERLGEINKSFIYPSPSGKNGIPVIAYNHISLSINAYQSSGGVPVKSLVYYYETDISTYINGFKVSGTLTNVTYTPLVTSTNQYLMTATIIGSIKDPSNGLIIRGILTLVNYTGRVFVNVRPTYVSSFQSLDEVMRPNFAIVNVTALNANTPEFITPVPVNVPGERPYNSTFNYIELQFLQEVLVHKGSVTKYVERQVTALVFIPHHYYNVPGSYGIFTAVPGQDEILPGIVFELN